MPTRTGLGLALAFALSCGPARADGRIEYRTDGACAVHFASIEVAGPRLRMEVTPAGGEPLSSIFDGDEDLVTTMVPSQRRFMRMEVDADAADYSGDVVKSTVTYMDRQMAKMQEVMEAQCKNQRCPQMPDLGAMMGNNLPPADPYTTRDTADAGNVGGVACTWREWVRAEGVVRRECLADIAALPLPDADRAGLRRGMRVMMNYGASMSVMTERFGTAPEPNPPVGKFPVAHVCFAGGAEAGQATATVTEAPVDPQRFEVPAGYAPMMGPGSDMGGDGQ
jgi:hypothetical protein